MFKKKWIKMDEIKKEDEVQQDQTEATEETKEENKMGFFGKHKKGIILGGLGALAAGVAGLMIIKNKVDDDDYDEDYEDDDFEDEDVTEDAVEESAAD